MRIRVTRHITIEGDPEWVNAVLDHCYLQPHQRKEYMPVDPNTPTSDRNWMEESGRSTEEIKQ